MDPETVTAASQALSIDWKQLIPGFNAADIIGVIGLISTIVIYQQKTKNSLFWTKIISDSIWLVHYILIGATSTIATAVVSIFRSYVFMNRDRKWGQSKLWPAVFFVSTIVFSLIAWQGPITLLTMIGSLMCILAYYSGDPKLIRRIVLPAGIMYLIYMFYAGSVTGVINDMFTVISSLVGIIRLDILKKPPKTGDTDAASGENGKNGKHHKKKRLKAAHI